MSKSAASVLGALLFGSVLVLASCDTDPHYPNRMLAAGTSNPRPHLANPDDPNDPVILLAFSGGGARATALGLAVLDQLARYSYKRQSDGKVIRLIDRVAIVSSVSGGSVAAAWFGLAGPDHMDELTDRFLSQDNMASLEWAAADPVTWTRLLFSGYTRIDVLTKLLDDKLFQNKTFAAMNRPGAPLVILNSTDMASGEVFSFTPERFDDICSDLSALPISVGVAASAAFPIALSPMNLQDFSGANCKGAIPADRWISVDLDTVGARYINLEDFKRARYANALRHGPEAFREIDYLHLLDGGLADNQGGHAITEAILSPHDPRNLLLAINAGLVKRVVVISVNARSDSDSGLERNAAVPGLFDAINTVTGVPIDSTTAYSNASIQELVDELDTASTDAEAAHQGDPLFKGLRVYNVSIDFDQFRKDQSGLRDRVKAIGTSWNLTPDALKDTMNAGQMLVTQHACFQHLLVDMGVAAPFIDPAFVKEGCPMEGD